MKEHEFPNGLTVKELKAAIADWPEVYADGSSCEVWITTGPCQSSPVVLIAPLNVRPNGTGESSDMILESDVF